MRVLSTDLSRLDWVELCSVDRQANRIFKKLRLAGGEAMVDND